MYTYHKATENGMTLHIIETDASNIRPVQLLKTSNLKGSNEYGINGFVDRTCSVDTVYRIDAVGKIRLCRGGPDLSGDSGADRRGFHQPGFVRIL